MKKYIFLFLILNILGVRYIALKQQVTQTEAERLSKIESYNAGFRAGKMEILAIQVECQEMRDEQIINDYWVISEVLRSWGELDEMPYPCQE